MPNDHCEFLKLEKYNKIAQIMYQTDGVRDVYHFCVCVRGFGMHPMRIISFLCKWSNENYRRDW